MPATNFDPPPFHPRRPGLVSPVPLDPTGVRGPTRGQAKGRCWRRTSHGLYVPDHVDDTLVEQRIVEAAAVLPEVCGVTGWAALRWLGGRWFDGLGPGGRGRRPVWLATGGSDVRRQSGIEPSAERLDPGELLIVDGVCLTVPARSVCFEMRYAASVRQAVQVLDMAAYSDLVSIAEVAAYAAEHPGWTGIPRCRHAIALADENSWSPRETAMRLVWSLEAGYARPLCNAPVFDRAGRHVGTPDLIDPEAGVLGEYDGGLHLQGVQRARDVRREGDFRGLGLECVTMLAGDTADPTDFLRRLHAAYRRARWLPEGRRAWTLQPPAWWTPTTTVAQRRSLDERQRARLLALRAG
jgi:hypothetical protein